MKIKVRNHSSHVSKTTVEFFMKKYPAVIDIAKNGTAMDLDKAALEGKFPYTGLLQSIWTYLNMEPLSIVNANGREYYVYVDFDSQEDDSDRITLECSIRNKD